MKAGELREPGDTGGRSGVSIHGEGESVLMALKNSDLTEALAILAMQAHEADSVSTWPTESWQALQRCGALGWCIPVVQGGDELNAAALLDGYERLAGACLTTGFILSQRDAACRRLRDSGNETLCNELLPRLARG